DVIHDDLTAVCAVSENVILAKKVPELFSTDCFRVYVQTDVIGAEIGAGMKNIIAIASGIMEGLGYHDNTRAALITRGLAEMTRFGLAKGASAQTFLGLTGVGDLTLTASSHRSRNYTLGIDIGKEDDATAVLERNQKTVEGVLAAKTIHAHAKLIGVETPITDAVYEVLYEKKKPSLVVAELMRRALKAE
ncbi:MAG: NAD(P)H-dependent glycerol-3-phosphate dehydrogenase, partial [Bacilli bacterium]|nr:NAD(P)H-dependent glycerol-3-phosphate dehydrogenase [Bacilli bacterium]